MSRTPSTPEEQDAAQQEQEQKIIIPKIVTFNPMKIGLTLDGDDVTITAIVPSEMVNVNIPVLAFEALIAEYANASAAAKAEESGLILPDKQLIVP